MVSRSASKRASGAGPGDVVVALLRAADRVRRRTARAVEPHGITLQQYNVLRILERAKEDGVPTLEVASRMIEETPGVTRLLDRLEAKAYIRRQRCVHDRRQHLCWLSGEGARVLDALKPVLTAEHERAFQGLDRETRRQLLASLDVIGSDR